MKPARLVAPTSLYTAILLFAVATARAEPPAPPDSRPARQTEIRVTSEDPSALQRSITEAAKSGFTKLVIPSGTYRLASPPKGRFYLQFAELSDLEIDATGVTLLRTDPTVGGIAFDRCRDVTLRGVTLLNETPPFTQGASTVHVSPSAEQVTGAEGW